MTQSANNVWHDEVIKAIVHLPMDRGMVAEVKNGLEFGQQVNLPSNLTFSLLLLTKLFASDGIVRPFQHLRYSANNVKFNIMLVVFFQLLKINVTPPSVHTAITSLCWSPIFLDKMTSFFLSQRYELNMNPG